MISFKHSGDFKNTDNFLKRLTNTDDKIRRVLSRYGNQGVAALASATPIDSGLTASSWGYEIVSSGKKHTIYWTNSNLVNGIPVAVLIQYGHATGNGGYVQGQDFINPILKPIFEKIANDAWREVTNL